MVKFALPLAVAAATSAVVGAANPSGAPVCLSQGVEHGGSAGIPKGHPLNDPVKNYCGGANASKYPEDQRACSPFAYTPFVSNWAGFGPLTYGPFDTPTGLHRAQSNRAWASYDAAGKRNSSDFWVFHSGDGAGIRDACVGDCWFIERMGKPKGKVDDTHPRELSSWCDGGKGNNRTESPLCPFVHPGSSHVFDEYFVGNLWEDYDGPSKGNILDESAFRGTNDPRKWKANVSKSVLDVLKDPKQNPFAGNSLNMQFMLFPWVGKEDAKMTGNNFAYPTLTSEKGVRCYADNEPVSDSEGKAVRPPIVEIYSLLEERDAKGVTVLRGAKWMYDLQTTGDAPRLEVPYFTLSPCDGTDCVY